jgi:hypothetical protein
MGNILAVTESCLTKWKGCAKEIFQSVFMIRKLIVVHHETSIPVFEQNYYENSSMDTSIIAGVLNAITSIGKEMIGAPTSIKKIEFHGFVVVSAVCGAYSVYLFSERDLHESLVEGVNRIAKWFDLIFGYDGAQWDGSMDLFNKYNNSIQEKICKELFLWFIYSIQISDVNPDKIKSFGIVEKEIYSYIKERREISCVVLLDQISIFTTGELLEGLFNLVETGLISTNYCDS